MPTPRDKSLYNKVKQQVYREIPKHSAYRSGIVVQKYKRQFNKKHPHKNPYIGKKTKKKGLSRWFKEKWRNQRGKVGYKYKSDVYRPTRRITKQTPRTFKELGKRRINKARTIKYRKGRVAHF